MTQAFQLRPWTQVALPHADIRAGRLTMSDFAADLGAVLRRDKNLSAVYLSGVAFFRATHLTDNLRRLYGDVMRVLAGGDGDRIIQLRTPFGGGKTHALIGLYYLAGGGRKADGTFHDGCGGKAMNDAIPELKTFPQPGDVRIACLSGVDLDPKVPQTMTDGTVVRTLWGHLAWQLGGRTLFRKVCDSETGKELLSCPGGEALSAVLGDSPTLVLLDEFIVYVTNANAVEVVKSTMGQQAMIFAQRLTEKIRDKKHAAVVYSLQASIGEAFGQDAVLAMLEHLVDRVDAKREPVRDDEVLRVVQRRLFENLGDEKVREQVAIEYARALSEHLASKALTEEAKAEAHRIGAKLKERILLSYPFHPDLPDLMYHRWGSLPSYQRTRGALQFLARVVQAHWTSPGKATPLIGPADVPLDDEGVRSALFSQVGNRSQFDAVLSADLIGAKARVNTVDTKFAGSNVALREIRPAYRTATATFLCSFGGKSVKREDVVVGSSVPTEILSDQRRKATAEETGITETELVAMMTAPHLPGVVAEGLLPDLRSELMYLYAGNRRYRFSPEPNINNTIREEIGNVPSEYVLKHIRDGFEKLLPKSIATAVWPAGGYEISDQGKSFIVAYLGMEHAQVGMDQVEATCFDWLQKTGTSRRNNQNSLAFAVPDKRMADSLLDSCRKLIALTSILKPSRIRSLGLADDQVDDIKERLEAAEGVYGPSLAGLYKVVLLPLSGTNGGIRWEPIDLGGQVQMGGLHATVLRTLDQYVFPQIRGNRIAQLFALGQPGPKGQQPVRFVCCAKVLENLQRYLDYPKVTGPEAVQAGIANGIVQGDFAYVASARVKNEGGVDTLEIPNPGTIRYSGSVLSSDVDVSDLAFILEPSYAKSFIATAPTPQTTPQPAFQEQIGSGGTAQPPQQPLQPAPTQPATPGQPARTYTLSINGDKRVLIAIGQMLSRLYTNCDEADVAVQVRARNANGFKPDQIYRIEEPVKEKGITPQSSTGA